MARVAERLELYGSYTRGLEEAGTAPASAVNRNAVLSAVIATQREIGLRYAISPGLSAVVAGFDTRKPYAGLGADNRFDLLGTVRHRGVEASLSGRVAPGLSVVAGGVYVQPRLTGDSVAQGLIGTRPVGVPSWRIIANASYGVSQIPGLTLDAGGEFTGRQFWRSQPVAGQTIQPSLPSTFVVDAGVRYRFKIGDAPVTMRAQILNAFNNYGFDVNGAETLDYTAPRRFRLLLTGEF